MNTVSRKVLASLAVVAGAGALATYGIFGAFSAETVNAGNEFSSATLELTSSNDALSDPVYFATNAVPGDSGDTADSCIEITYSGTVPAEVRLYGDMITEGDGLAPGVLLRITEGDGGSEDSCASFEPSGSAGDIYGGSSGSDVQTIRILHSSWDQGFNLGTWSPDESRTYRYESWLSPTVDPTDMQGKNAGEQSFVWEARAGD